MSPPQRTHPRAGSGGRRRSGQLQRPSVLPSTCPPSLSIHRSPEPPGPDHQPPPQAPSDPRRLPGPRRGGSCWAEPALGCPAPGEPLGCSPRGEGPYREAGPTLPGPPRPGGGGEREENARRGRSSAAPRGTPGSVPVPAPGAGSRELRGRSARNLTGAEPVCRPGSPHPPHPTPVLGVSPVAGACRGSRYRPRHARRLPAAGPDGAAALRHTGRRHGPARLQPHLPAAVGAGRSRSRSRSGLSTGASGRRAAAGICRAGRALPGAQRELPPALPPPRLLQHRAVPGAARARPVRAAGTPGAWGAPRPGGCRGTWGTPGCSGAPGMLRGAGGGLRQVGGSGGLESREVRRGERVLEGAEGVGGIRGARRVRGAG